MIFKPQFFKCLSFVLLEVLAQLAQILPRLVFRGFFSVYFYPRRAYFGIKGEVGIAPAWTVQFSTQCTDSKHAFLPEKDPKCVVYFRIYTNPSPTFLAISLLSLV